MYIKRAEVEMAQKGILKERIKKIQEAKKMAENLRIYCIEYKIGPFEMPLTKGRVSFFPEKDRPHFLTEFDKANKKRKTTMQKTLESARALITFCDIHKVGAFETKTATDVIAFAPRPF